MSEEQAGRNNAAEQQGATWHVFGAGALGTVIAHHLADAGIACTLLSHRRSGRQALHLAGARHHIEVRHIGEIPRRAIKRLLLTTKAGQITDAMHLALPRLAADAVVLTTANGLGFPEVYPEVYPEVFPEVVPEAVPERLSEAVRGAPGDLRQSVSQGHERYALRRAVSTAAAYRDESGAVILAAIGDTRVGGTADIAPWFSDSLARLPDWHWESDIARAVSSKFALNCVINPLTASRRCRNGELVDNPEAAAELAALCAETQPALRALDLWPEDQELLPRAQRVCRATAANRSSMLQDVLAGRETEIVYLTGELLRRAHAHGLSLSRNSALYSAVRALHPRSPGRG